MEFVDDSFDLKLGCAAGSIGSGGYGLAGVIQNWSDSNANLLI